MKTLVFSIVLLLINGVAAASSVKLEDLKQRYHLGPDIRATITVYTDDPRENGGQRKPSGTAIGTKIRPGIVAVSRDLLKSGWNFGDKLFIEDMGVFTIEDAMHARFRNRVDVAVANKAEARRIGMIKNRLVVLLKKKKLAGSSS